MENRRAVGTAYEERTAEYLESEGYRILEKNFRCSLGEIDLIAEEKGVLVFVEVKYRSSGSCGAPEEAVNERKQKKICRTADYYRMKHKIPESVPCRFDVAALTGNEIRHIRNAFFYR